MRATSFDQEAADVQNGDITKGNIFVDGEDITNLNPSKIVEKGIAQVMEGRRLTNY